MPNNHFNTMEATSLELAKVFSDDFEFYVPDYQRPYSWRTEEAKQLLVDLREAISEEDREPYFLGSIVIVKAPGRDSRADVIDGQQRLVTLTLLLACMRDTTPDAELQRDIHTMIERAAVKYRGQKNNRPARPRIHLAERDRSFFEKYIFTKGGTKKLLKLDDSELKTHTQQRLWENAKVLSEDLAISAPEYLEDLYIYMSTDVHLIVVTTYDIESAYRVFSVMNSRGLSLTSADIFKAKIIGEISEGDRNRYSNSWEEHEEYIGREEFSSLFGDIRFAETGIQQRKAILQEFETQVMKPYLSTNGQMGAFMDDVITPYSDALLILLGSRPTSEPKGAIKEWREIRNVLNLLNEVDNRDWRPVALKAIKSLRSRPSDLLRALEELERLVAYLTVAGVHRSYRLSRYAEAVRRLGNFEEGALESLSLTDEERKRFIEILDGPIYQNKACKYILLKLNSCISDPDEGDMSFGRITIEHVLPQRPGENSVWRQVFDEDQRRYWTHRMANLVLLGRRKNSSSNNKDFETKKSTYYKGSADTTTGISLTVHAMKELTWTPDTLAARQKELLSYLSRAWRLQVD